MSHVNEYFWASFSICSLRFFKKSPLNFLSFSHFCLSNSICDTTSSSILAKDVEEVEEERTMG